MPIIKIHVNCSERSEVLFENEEESEAMIENVVSTALLELFDTVEVKKVTINDFSDDTARQGYDSWM